MQCSVLTMRSHYCVYNCPQHQVIDTLSTLSPVNTEAEINLRDLNTTEFLLALENLMVQAAARLPAGTSTTLRSSDGKATSVLSNGNRSNCGNGTSDSDVYHLVATQRRDTVEGFLPGPCTNAYSGGGGSAAMVILDSSELTKTGQVFDVGNGQVVMFRVDGYQPGSSFPPPFRIRFKVNKPQGQLIEEPCRFYDDLTNASAWPQPSLA